MSRPERVVATLLSLIVAACATTGPGGSAPLAPIRTEWVDQNGARHDTLPSRWAELLGRFGQRTMDSGPDSLVITAYRFVRAPSFGRTALIQVEERLTLPIGFWMQVQTLDRAGRVHAGPWRRLTWAQWTIFTRAVEQAHFWDLSPSECHATDGEDWYIEGLRKERRHAVWNRTCVEPPLDFLGTLLATFTRDRDFP